LRDAAARSATTEDNTQPDPIDRIEMIDWVFRNKIMKRIQPPEDASVAAESETKTVCVNTRGAAVWAMEQE